MRLPTFGRQGERKLPPHGHVNRVLPEKAFVKTRVVGRFG